MTPEERLQFEQSLRTDGRLIYENGKYLFRMWSFTAWFIPSVLLLRCIVVLMFGDTGTRSFYIGLSLFGNAGIGNFLMIFDCAMVGAFVVACGFTLAHLLKLLFCLKAYALGDRMNKLESEG